MDRTVRENTAKWIECWRRAAPELERIRREDIRNADTKRAVAMFSGLLADTRRRGPVADTSGLIEQQALFSKVRR